MTKSRNHKDPCNEDSRPFLTREEFQEHLDLHKDTIEKLENQLQSNYDSTKNLEELLKPLADNLEMLGVMVDVIYKRTSKLKYQVAIDRDIERKIHRKKVLFHSTMMIIVLVVSILLSLR